MLTYSSVHCMCLYNWMYIVVRFEPKTRAGANLQHTLFCTHEYGTMVVFFTFWLNFSNKFFEQIFQTNLFEQIFSNKSYWANIFDRMLRHLISVLSKYGSIIHLWLKLATGRFNIYCLKLIRSFANWEPGCQIFLVTMYQSGEKYAKWLQNYQMQ
jgi:hypothetical protein